MCVVNQDVDLWSYKEDFLCFGTDGGLEREPMVTAVTVRIGEMLRICEMTFSMLLSVREARRSCEGQCREMEMARRYAYDGVWLLLVS